MGLFNSNSPIKNVYFGVKRARAVFLGEVKVWPIFPEIPFDPAPRYLLVAGGGGGASGGGGGGGAGGVLTGALDLTPGITYAITVGAGGSGATIGNSVGKNGSNSSLNNIVAIGGGGGSAPDRAPISGGSGGGAARAGKGDTETFGAPGVLGQGNKGGDIVVGTNSASGGGGGAAEAGGNSDALIPGTPGFGGSGVAINITGDTEYYGGGGGGGVYSRGPIIVSAGGYGGGGDGGAEIGGVGANGLANSGGGGGAGIYTIVSKAGGAGGSGVCILSIPTVEYSGVYTGTPEVFTNADNTILKFTSNGTYETAAVVEEPPYLYAVDVEYLPNYEVKFTAKKGFMPADPSEEAFMFRCVQMPKDGYVSRTFSKQWSANGYSKLDCTLEDLYGDGIPANNAEMMKTINFTITPKP